MRNLRFKQHMYWGITAVFVILVSVVFAFLLTNLKGVQATIKSVIGILMPVIYGGILAYLLLPIYNRVYDFLSRKLKTRVKNKKVQRGIPKFVATLVSLITIILIVVGLFSLLLPEIYDSIFSLQSSLESNISSLNIWLQEVMDSNEEMAIYVQQVIDMLSQWLGTDLLPSITRLIGGVSSGLLSVFTLLKNILIGVIVMIYLLNIKETLIAQGKKITYSVFKIQIANQLIEKTRLTHKIFGGFITGKLLDSLIIGIITFVVLSIMKMPYVVLVSVIIGVTNVIPFFGPFIGAIPSAFLILLVSPVQCLYFIIFIVLLQQFDGNILGPKILGDSTGLPSFWVLFSILLFGGLFGFVGMIIAVPTAAVVYHLISEAVNKSLTKKELPTNTQDYKELDYIDVEKKTYIK